MSEGIENILNAINPLDNIRKEITLLALFQNIMSENMYIDSIVKDIFEHQNETKQMIYRKDDKCVYLMLNELNILQKELNEKIKPRSLKCSIENVSCKDFSKMVEPLKLEPAFICRECYPLKIFDNEDELRTHREKRHHRFNSGVPQRDYQITILKNNTTCVSVPLFELFEKSGAIAEINNRIKSINLKCDIFKLSSRHALTPNMLEFEPAIICRQCPNQIFATKEELEKHQNEHVVDRKKYSRKSSNPNIKRQREHEQFLKGRDRTR